MGKANDYIASWIQMRKGTMRVENIKPGEWFQQTNKKWNGVLAQWKQKHMSYKAQVQNKLKAKQQKQIVREQKQKEAEAKKKLKELQKANGQKSDDKEDDKKEEDKKEPEEEEHDPVDRKTLDVFGVEHIMDVENGEPLF